jgi:hypothetical protein
MTAQQQNLRQAGASQGAGKFFGIPLGDLGLFSSILMAFSVGFLSFFLFTFLAIAGIGIYNSMGHHVDYAESYKYISFPAGCVVLVASLIFFGTLWMRRKLSGG